MDLRDDQNPYAPPAATEERPYAGADDDELQVTADRWTRWLARFIDGLLGLGLIIPLFLREWVIAGIGFIPGIGTIVSLVDVLMIFGQDQRCLHDRIAGTKVIAVIPTV